MPGRRPETIAKTLVRDQRIRAARADGLTIRELAVLEDLTERHVCRLLNPRPPVHHKKSPQKRPPPLRRALARGDPQARLQTFCEMLVLQIKGAR